MAYRIADTRHPLMDGYGALLFGGRWNSPGRKAIYASLSYSCAMLEILAHVGRLGHIPKNHQYVKITIPSFLKIESFPQDKIENGNPTDMIASRDYGDKWLQEKRTVGLIVPSVIAIEDKNIIFNPEHSDYAKILLSEPHEIIWDQRLFV